MRLTIVGVDDDNAEDWRVLHNTIIPAHPLTAEDVAASRQRYRLTLAYVDDQLVGNATLRPPVWPDQQATVIVRIAPAVRRQGLGTEYSQIVVREARELGAKSVATVVLADNVGGVPFALRAGLVEVERYCVDGAEYIDLAEPADGQ